MNSRFFKVFFLALPIFTSLTIQADTRGQDQNPAIVLKNDRASNSVSSELGNTLLQTGSSTGKNSSIRQAFLDFAVLDLSEFSLPEIAWSGLAGVLALLRWRRRQV